MKRLAYIATLSAMVVLMFAAIASAQDSSEQSSSDLNDSSTDQAQSPTPGDQEATPSEQATPTQNEPTVSILESAFDPPQLEVPSETTVMFVNEDSVAHTVSLDDLFDSSEIPPGGSYPVWLKGSGTVTYHDAANPEMQGSITVVEAGQGEASTPEESTG